jgi:hypothetical protein
MKRLILLLLLSASCMFGASIKNDAYVATSVDNMIMMCELFIQKDSKALDKMEERGMIKMVKQGTQVQIVSNFKSFYQVRIFGELETVWIIVANLNL